MSCCVKILSSTLLLIDLPLTILRSMFHLLFPKEDFLDKSWESLSTQNKLQHTQHIYNKNLNQFLIHYPSKTTSLTDSTTDKLSTCIWLVILSLPFSQSFIHQPFIKRTICGILLLLSIPHTQILTPTHPIFCYFIF